MSDQPEKHSIVCLELLDRHLADRACRGRIPANDKATINNDLFGPIGRWLVQRAAFHQRTCQQIKCEACWLATIAADRGGW
ncbi:hypothetical protein [Xanthomonas arboricola]|uniref:hypothetical protein n=1 Tax=Xanthomonas arboricola TaxID=56448 RepID=UPI00161CBB47|nr:hypothetical protein [Xanthomonas arboricola]MBB5858911.1 hypothetical protein [Xanthomonas arboricola]